MTPTARSLKWLRDRGYICDVAESFNFFSKRRKDLFGFIDVVALGEQGIIAIQVSTMANKGARISKIEGSTSASAWVNCGGLIWVMLWRKLKTGGREIWTPAIIEMTNGDKDGGGTEYDPVSN